MIFRRRGWGRIAAGRAQLQTQRERTRAWGDLHSRRGGEAERGRKINAKTCRGRGRAEPGDVAAAMTRWPGLKRAGLWRYAVMQKVNLDRSIARRLAVGSAP